MPLSLSLSLSLTFFLSDAVCDVTLFWFCPLKSMLFEASPAGHCCDYCDAGCAECGRYQYCGHQYYCGNSELLCVCWPAVGLCDCGDWVNNVVTCMYMAQVSTQTDTQAYTDMHVNVSCLLLVSLTVWR